MGPYGPNYQAFDRFAETGKIEDHEWSFFLLANFEGFFSLSHRPILFSRGGVEESDIV